MPIFLAVAVIFHVTLDGTRHGRYTYAVSGNVQAARVSGIDVTGIDVTRHLTILVHAIAAVPAGLGGVIAAARAASGQAGMARPTSWPPPPRHRSAAPVRPAASGG